MGGMADATTLTTYLDAARTAISAGDSAKARIQIALAKTVLAELPNIGADGVTAAYQNSIAALDSAMMEMARAGGPRFIRIEYDGGVAL